MSISGYWYTSDPGRRNRQACQNNYSTKQRQYCQQNIDYFILLAHSWNHFLVNIGDMDLELATNSVSAMPCPEIQHYACVHAIQNSSISPQQMTAEWQQAHVCLSCDQMENVDLIWPVDLLALNVSPRLTRHIIHTELSESTHGCSSQNRAPPSWLRVRSYTGDNQVSQAKQQIESSEDGRTPVVIFWTLSFFLSPYLPQVALYAPVHQQWSPFRLTSSTPLPPLMTLRLQDSIDITKQQVLVRSDTKYLQHHLRGPCRPRYLASPL